MAGRVLPVQGCRKLRSHAEGCLLAPPLTRCTLKAPPSCKENKGNKGNIVDRASGRVQMHGIYAQKKGKKRPRVTNWDADLKHEVNEVLA